MVVVHPPMRHSSESCFIAPAVKQSMDAAAACFLGTDLPPLSPGLEFKETGTPRASAALAALSKPACGRDCPVLLWEITHE